MMIQFADDPAPINWGEENQDLVEFLKAATWSDFYQSLYRSYIHHGRLTPKQEACARSGYEKAQARKAAEPAESGIDLTPLAGYYAAPGGDSRLKVLVQHGQGKWAGWIFVKDAAVYGAGTRYGSQKPGAKYQGKIVDALQAILDDPQAAQVEYGKLTGRCGVCHRPLEDEESVARGIGPICAGRIGL